jgi:hypothetical protein
MEVEITYELEDLDLDETFKVDLEVRLSKVEKDVGWQGHMEDYEVLAVTPAWPLGVELLYEKLKAHEAEIESMAFTAGDEQ